MTKVHLFHLVGVVVVCALWANVEGHGRLVDPPGRSTMWRFGFDTPVQYTDNQLYCGSYSRQWSKNHGRCGVCGDPWDIPRPRPNEAGGTWGTGVISKVYRQGQIITATVQLTANHMGWFEFRLCPNNNPKQYVKQSCLNKHVLKLVDYPGTKYRIKHKETGLFSVRLQLPKNLICSQCVVQWHYTTGNIWGHCKNGSRQTGCGPQEVFRGCSDVAVFAPGDPTYFKVLNLTTEANLSQFLHQQGIPQFLTENEVDDFSAESSEFSAESYEIETESNEVDVAEVINLDSVEVKDIVKSNTHFVSSFSKNHRRPATWKAPTTFVSDYQPIRQQNEDHTFRSTEFVNEEQLNTLPPSKKHVSSDNFRKNLRIDKVNPISAPTFFLTTGKIHDVDSKPIVFKPNYLGVTPTPLVPPLLFPPPSANEPFLTPGGIQSIHSSQPSDNHVPILENTTGKEGISGSSPGASSLPDEDTLSSISGLSPSILHLLQKLSSLRKNALTTGRSPGGSKVPLSSLQKKNSLQYLLFLQQALGLATSSSATQKKSPVVFILG